MDSVIVDLREKEYRAKICKTGLCGGNLLDTPNPIEVGKDAVEKEDRCTIERLQTSGMVSCVFGW